MIDVRFHRGLHLPELDLWLDPWDARPQAFVSHAHADHFARHEQALCSTVTAALLRARYQVAEERLRPQAYQVPLEWEGFRLRLLPAGHIFGSAMLHVTRLKDQATLLYTGDFKVRRGRVAEAVHFQSADTLIMETTFGLPQYVFPGALEVEAAVLRFVHDALGDGETPVLLGYSLGKAQEALALLAEHEIPCLLHPAVAEMTAACRTAGAKLPEPRILDGAAPPGFAVIAPPHAVRAKLLRNLQPARTAMLSGWALHPDARFRYRVDEVIPMSDHADHPGLWECIQRVRPKRVWTVHGSAREFAAELRGRRIEAWCAMGGDQLELLPAVSAGPIGPRASASPPARQSRPICPLADFSDLCRLLGETQSRLTKADHVAAYLKTLEAPEDLRLAAAWLSGEALPRGHGCRPLQTGGATLRRALLSLPGAQESRYREISLGQNDAARTARLFLRDLPLRPEPLDLAGTAAFFAALADASGGMERIALLADRLARLHPVEGETLVKLLTGDLRAGLGEGILEEAIRLAFGVETAAVRHATLLTGDPAETAVLARQGRLAEAGLRPGVAVKCMLASPLARDPADERPLFETIPHPPPYWIEPKLDGIRVQLHKHGEHASLFSRDLKPLDDSFPEILAAALAVPGDFVLDGELVAPADQGGRGFADVQKRLGRKAPENDLFTPAETRAARSVLRLLAFDLLWLDGREIWRLPLAERRRQLDELPLPSPLERMPARQAADTGELADGFKSALAQGHEGLILKDPQSPYAPGRRGRAWIKLKGVMPTLDCVVVTATQGHGKRAGLLSDYTFAVRDETSGELRVLGRAYSGLTDAEIEELTAHFHRRTHRKERRHHHVSPDIVLEIAFDAIRPSPRHDSGLALRFPRIKALRRDKTLADIDTLQTALSLLPAKK